MDDSPEAYPFVPLLAADEAAPFTVLHAASTRPLLLVCDHASRRIPQALGDLGLEPAVRRSHLALDIGAAELTRRLASSLRVTAVLAGYSRLAVDCNRHLVDPGAFLDFGDGVPIPGNRNLSPAEKSARAGSIYWPYHRAIDAQLTRLLAGDAVPAVLAIHSFTPVLNGVSRPWEMGILSDADHRIAERVMRGLKQAGFVVGDNEPYSGKAPEDFTIDTHAEAAGLPHAGIEVRQDLIDSDEGIAAVAAVLYAIVEDIPPEVFAVANGASADGGERRMRRRPG